LISPTKAVDAMPNVGFYAKRYQVFVSSTCVDLQEERQAVIQVLLRLNCFPAIAAVEHEANDVKTSQQSSSRTLRACYGSEKSPGDAPQTT
jgi:hypothetical protein